MARHRAHIELLLFRKLETYDVWRWIEDTAVKIDSFDIFGISYISELGSHIHHEGQYIIIGADRKNGIKEKLRADNPRWWPIPCFPRHDRRMDWPKAVGTPA